MSDAVEERVKTVAYFYGTKDFSNQEYVLALAHEGKVQSVEIGAASSIGKAVIGAKEAGYGIIYDQNESGNYRPLPLSARVDVMEVLGEK